MNATTVPLDTARKVQGASLGMLDGLPPVITTADVSRITGRSEKVVRNDCATGRIKATRMGKCWMIPRDALLKQLGLMA